VNIRGRRRGVHVKREFTWREVLRTVSGKFADSVADIL
jgi:hypothetical protein